MSHCIPSTCQWIFGGICAVGLGIAAILYGGLSGQDARLRSVESNQAAISVRLDQVYETTRATRHEVSRINEYLRGDETEESIYEISGDWYGAVPGELQFRDWDTVSEREWVTDWRN